MRTRVLRSDAGAMSTGAIVAVAVSVAAVLGLLVGAVWGLAGGGSDAGPSASGPTGPVASSTAPASPSEGPTGATTSPSPTGTSMSPTPAPAPTGAVPPAPATTTTSADGWRLGRWRITNDGSLGVDTTARNTTTGTRSADLVLYVYVDGRHIATTTARVTDVPAGGTVPVRFTGTDAWQPGQKVLLLQVA